jgi:hypothetical protein
LIGPTDAHKAKITHPNSLFVYKLLSPLIPLILCFVRLDSQVPSLVSIFQSFPIGFLLIYYGFLYYLDFRSIFYWLLLLFFQYQSSEWSRFRKELCSWFRFSSINSKIDLIFLWRDIFRLYISHFFILFSYLKWFLFYYTFFFSSTLIQGCQKRFFDTTRNIQFKLDS